jgi:hypothetical protein
MRFVTSLCRTSVHFVYTLLLGFLILGFSTSVCAQKKVVFINYGKLVDRSQLTHSGHPVGTIIEQLEKIPPFDDADFADFETKWESFEQRQAAFEKRRLAFNRKVHSLNAKRKNPVTLIEALDTLSQKSELQSERALMEQEQASIAIELKMWEPRLDAYQMYKGRKNLQSEIEPFLEPFSFLLNDALATSDPETVKRPLIDIGSLFPEGEPQPAWADLVRTRRYHVLSDGAGFVRVFVPGKDAEQAYSDHYGVLRHVLNWVLRSSQPATQLRVEVYAYENDIAANRLALHLPSRRFDVNAPLGPAQGAVPLDLSSLERFLKKGLMLEGAYTNETNSLILYGSERPQKPSVEGQPISLADLAVAYRAVFYSGHGDAYISLDRSPFPEQVNVNFGGRLADTRIGWVVLRSDMRFKTLGDDLDPELGVRLAADLRRKMPDFLTQQERFNSVPADKRPASESTRFWFYPDSVSVSQSADKKFMRISSPRFTGAAERQEASQGDKQLSSKTPPWTTKTLDHLNRNYATFAKSFNELNELDNIGTMLALFTWLKEREHSDGLSIDLDALLDVELPKCSTPRRRPQMIVGYFKKGRQVEPIDFSWIAEDIASRRPREGALPTVAKAAALPTTAEDLHAKVSFYLATIALRDLEIDSMEGSVVAGGIDLGMEKVIKKPKPLSLPDKSLYTRLKQARPESRIPTPRKVFARSESSPSIDPYRPSTPKPHPQQVIASEATGKSQWLRTGSSNASDLAPSKTVHVNDEGTAVSFARFEQGQQHHYRLVKSGDNFMAEAAPRLARTSEDAAIINGALKNESTTQVWRHLPDDTRVAAIEKTSDGRTAILEEVDAGKYKLTYYKDGNAGESFTDKQALNEIEDIARSNVGGGGGGNRNDSNLTFVYPSEDGENFQLMIGKKRKDISALEMEELLANPTNPEKMTLDDVFKQEANGPREFVIYRDALTRRPERFGGSLKAGRADDPVRFAVALRERYSDARVYLDDEVDVAAQNQEALVSLRSPADLGVLAPEDSFSVTDHDLLKKITEALKSNGIRVFSTGGEIGNVPNVLLISGHNDANLVTYLTSLGEQGFLREKVLILNTCYAGDNPNLAHDLIQKFGARGVYLHTEAIRPVALQPVLNQLGTLLKEAERDGKSVHPGELMDRAVDRVLIDDSLSPRLKREILKLKRGVLQISELRMPGVNNDASGDD